MKHNRLSMSRVGKQLENVKRKTSSIGRTVSQTGLFLKGRIWVWPLVATVVLAGLVFTVRTQIESIMKENLRSELQTLLKVEVAMLEEWVGVQTSNATTAANDQRVRRIVYELVDQTADASASDVDSVRGQLQRVLNPTLLVHRYTGYVLVDRQRRVLASSEEDAIGLTAVPEYEQFLSRAFEGEATICPPFASAVAMKDANGQVQTGVPTMFACAPVQDDEDFHVVAALGLRIAPNLDFTRIMQLGRLGDSGETYAFDRSGVMVSNSRFDNDLILLGLLPDQPGSQSLLNLQLRDPQGDITVGYRPLVRRSRLPMTQMAADAIGGNSGVDVDGYRDYRGRSVIGAWTWLPDYALGVATEIDAAEAFRPLTVLKRSFWTLYALLGMSAVAIFVFSVLAARLRRDAQRAEIEAKQLGQYTLDDKIGAGAMGVVYKGHHAMLRRPTAIKLLDVDKVNDASIERFAREVQLTCQLNNPSTVAIFDYGRTPEGVFYYAMEYLDGIDLQTLIEQYGPQPEPRVIRILTQICSSLYEAHSLGLVHRDIKPANIMLNRRGCDADVVKVLDFGLVKALDERKQAGVTAANALTGTPLYMAPEAIQSPNSVDARSDLYAVGAVGYFLLTGEPVFDAEGVVQLCQMHVDAVPVPPSQRSGRAVSQELEGAILSCLEKARAKRPQTARDLAQSLARAPSAAAWSIDAAEDWWNAHERRAHSVASPLTASEQTTSVTDRTIIGNVES